MVLSDKEICSFWAGYIVQLRNVNEMNNRDGKYNDVIMEELLNELCKLYKVDKTLLDDLDYEYSKKIPLKLIMKKMNID
tara:strand:+ start:535 stop:771 length:237 start_codon:yes stop_codon:yes gene_type:complete